ncbi:MAG: aromatic-ring-hydroxylating dioxygenase subunit beta [Endozoicomonas sp.]|uniref:aromatic-ring-hydroxylating dioxygenase subunit beta n=1 Tax=Endozoicomonas sp. TaxID=1892382 RepID=UPI003D9AE33B
MSTINLELISQVEQFYFREARMLDNRQYQQWLGLLTEDIIYRIPGRHAAFADPKKKETEAFLDVGQELSQGLDTPLRDENLLILSVRVMRAFKQNSWTDNPPARTRRFVSNIEVLPDSKPDEFKVYSNLMLSYSRHQKDNYLYTAQREDQLRLVNGEMKIARREVILDWNVITAPSLSLFF